MIPTVILAILGLTPSALCAALSGPSEPASASAHLVTPEFNDLNETLIGLLARSDNNYQINWYFDYNCNSYAFSTTGKMNGPQSKDWVFSGDPPKAFDVIHTGTWATALAINNVDYWDAVRCCRGQPHSHYSSAYSNTCYAIDTLVATSCSVYSPSCDIMCS